MIEADFSKSPRKAVMPILLCDDDPDDRLLVRQALQECRIVNPLCQFENGEQLLDYLHRRGAWAETESGSRPGLILLDLNMPRKNGYEALREIKDNPQLCSLPVIVLTTSQAPEDIARAYELGANSYISKPVTFDGLIEVMRSLGQRWFEIVSMPQG